MEFKIIREGKEIVLNQYEMEKIYDALKYKYRREDIECRLEDNYPDVSFNDEEMKILQDRIEHSLGNNDSYYEAFWMTIDMSIENFITEKGKK